ncbi:hypothetical protein Prudu_139S000300, partial [Prunus dulcis]
MISLIRRQVSGTQISRAAILAGLGTPSLPSRKSWHSQFERPKLVRQVKCT